MRNIFLYIITVSMLLVSCIDDTIEKYKTSEELYRTGNVTLVASIENMYTRAAFDDTGKALWKKGDKIVVACADESLVDFNLEGTGDTKRAFFKGVISDGKTLGSYAVYPRSSLVRVEGNELIMNSMNGNECLYAMVASIGDTRDILFKQLFSYLRISLKNVPADAEYAVISTDVDNIFGEFRVNRELIGQDNYKVVGSESEMTYEFPDIATSQDMNICLPAGEYEDLNVSLYRNDGKKLITQKINDGTLNLSLGELKSIKATINPIESEKPKFITVCGVNWALGNLIYKVGNVSSGFRDGWKIADDQWFYFSYNYPSYQDKSSYNGVSKRTDISHAKTGYDHFNFGGIEDNFSCESTACASPSKLPFDITGLMFTDAGCVSETTDFESAKYGDITYWASNGSYRTPTSSELKKLRDQASYSLGYYNTGEKVNGYDVYVWGMLFTDPEDTQVKDLTMKEFTKDDLENGLFLPFAGRRSDSSSSSVIYSRTDGLYWSSMAQDKSTNSTAQAWKYTYSTYIKITSKEVMYGYTGGGERYNRQCGFSIRPVYCAGK